MTLLLAAWVFAALNTAYHLGAADYDFWFWVNLILMLAIPPIGIVLSRSNA